MTGRDDAGSAEDGAMLVLPARLDTPAVALLYAELAGYAGQPMRIDAGGVTHLGGLCLQVLLSARKFQDSAGLGFKVTPRSAAFDAALALFGASALAEERV